MNRQLKKSPLQQAVSYLFGIACNDATPQQILEVAEKFEVEVHTLEGTYLDAAI